MRSPRYPVSLALAAALAVAPTGPPAQAQTPTGSACGASYTVDVNPTLAGIAERCGVSIPALLAANPGVTDELDLEVGDRIRIPPTRGPQPGPQDACGVQYLVRPGDTLAEIARKCGLTVPLLVAANPPLPDPLGVGQEELRIYIPPLPRFVVDAEETFATRPAEADGEAVAAPPLQQIRGLLLEGDPCARIREPDGTVTGIIGTGFLFRPGDRVTVLGVPVESERCGTSRTIQLRIMYRAG